MSLLHLTIPCNIPVQDNCKNKTGHTAVHIIVLFAIPL